MKRALLVSMVKGLRGTGKPLVFEGVETPGQFEFACSLGPGYLGKVRISGEILLG